MREEGKGSRELPRGAYLYQRHFVRCLEAQDEGRRWLVRMVGASVTHGEVPEISKIYGRG
jgi:hypothetical protein